MCIARHFQNSRRGIKRTPLSECVQWGEYKSDGEDQPRQEQMMRQRLKLSSLSFHEESSFALGCGYRLFVSATDRATNFSRIFRSTLARRLM